jgi:multiple sugar transport system permease protein
MLKQRVEAGTFGSLSVGTMAGFVGASVINSTMTAMAVVIINLVLGSLGAYVLARRLVTGSFKIFIAMLLTRLLPAIAIIIPFYVIIRSLGLIDNILSLVLIYSAVTIPFSVWILVNYLAGIPSDMEESALVEGYSQWQVVRKIVYPLMKPGLVSVGIMSFMLSYVEFFFAVIITQTIASHTVPVVIAMLATNKETLLSLVNAAAVVAMLPPLVIVIIFRRYIVGGLTAGAIVRA